MKLPVPNTIRIIDESPDWIVVDKPANLQVHPSKPDGTWTLWHGLRDLLAFELVNGGQVSIINRLDRETSGLTLVCKSAAAARHFCRLMAERRIGKEYLALVWGWPERETYEIEAPLRRQGEVRPSEIWLKQCVHAGGAPAHTTVRVERRFRRQTTNGERFSLVRAIPETGRMHQIRVHLASIGHPIVGDKIYGPDERHYLEFIENDWGAALERSLLLPRQALHSAVLGIEGEGLRWEARLPADIENFLVQEAPPAASLAGA